MITIAVQSICLCEASGKYEVTSTVQGVVGGVEYGYLAQDGTDSAATTFTQFAFNPPITVSLNTVNVGDTVNVEVYDITTRQALARASAVYNGEVCSICQDHND